MTLKLTIIILFLINSITILVASENCGEYIFIGKIIKNTKALGYLMIINSNTKSEFRLKIATSEELKIAPYIDEFDILQGEMQKPFDGHEGIISKVNTIKRFPIDPFGKKNNSIQKLKKWKCQK